MALYGHICPYMGIYGHIYDHIWPYMDRWFQSLPPLQSVDIFVYDSPAKHTNSKTSDSPNFWFGKAKPWTAKMAV